MGLRAQVHDFNPHTTFLSISNSTGVEQCMVHLVSGLLSGNVWSDCCNLISKICRNFIAWIWVVVRGCQLPIVEKRIPGLLQFLFINWEKLDRLAFLSAVLYSAQSSFKISGWTRSFVCPSPFSFAIVSFELVDVMFSLCWCLFLILFFFFCTWLIQYGQYLTVVMYLDYPPDHQQMIGELAKTQAYYLYAR